MTLEAMKRGLVWDLARCPDPGTSLSGRIALVGFDD
jgi:hypothetical protein